MTSTCEQPGSSPIAAVIPVAVEVIFIRVDNAGCWQHRIVSQPLPSATDPSDQARRIAGWPEPAAAAIVHSTSWRYDLSGQLVLTYMAWPDPHPELPADRLPSMAIAHAADPAHPIPAGLAAAHVTAHAIRHLAFLARHDPAVSQVIHADPAMGRALAQVSPVPAGRIPSFVLPGLGTSAS